MRSTTKGKKSPTGAPIKVFTITACAVIAALAYVAVSPTGTTPLPKTTPASQPSINIQPVAVSNTLPDVNDVNTPEAKSQPVGSTQTLINNPNEQLRRTKKADSSFAFEDLTSSGTGTSLSGTVITSTTTTTMPANLTVATSPAPDVTAINTPSATNQKVGSTVTLVQNKYRRLRRTKDAGGKFEFEDVTAVEKYTPTNGKPVTTGLVPGSTLGSVVPVGAVTAQGISISLASAVSGGTPYASGCMDVTLTYFRYNKLLFGNKDPLYHMNVGAHWCAIGDHIGRTSKNGPANVPKMLWFTGLAPYLSSVVGSLSWAGGNYWDGMAGRAADSSWRIRGSQSVQQCFPVYGCSGYETPWIWADLHGNLTWYWDAGH